MVIIIIFIKKKLTPPNLHDRPTRSASANEELVNDERRYFQQMLARMMALNYQRHVKDQIGINGPKVSRPPISYQKRGESPHSIYCQSGLGDSPAVNTEGSALKIKQILLMLCAAMCIRYNIKQSALSCL